MVQDGKQWAKDDLSPLFFQVFIIYWYFIIYYCTTFEWDLLLLFLLLLLSCVVLCCVVLRCAVLCCAVLCCVVFCRVVLRCVVLRCVPSLPFPCLALPCLVMPCSRLVSLIHCTHTSVDDEKKLVEVVDSRVLTDNHGVAVVYHNPLDNVADLSHIFFNRCLEAKVTPYVVTKKTVFKWQEGFWTIMKKIFDAEYKTKFVEAGLLGKCGGELQHLISDAATMQV
jgi:hypothetical protein